DLSRYPMSYMSDDTDLYQYCMRSREYRVYDFFIYGPLEVVANSLLLAIHMIEGESKTCDPVKHHVIALATNNNRQYTTHSSVAFKCIRKRTALRYSPSHHTVIGHLPASVDRILVVSSKDRLLRCGRDISSS
ncbi:hypothetical protein [truncated ORF], partial [Aspergillus niger]|uniref:Uncharacterized protein n=2 Tax=Aspergillus niger TaxID=5061 RepID=A0AAJ8BN49_ASPNG